MAKRTVIVGITVLVAGLVAAVPFSANAEQTPGAQHSRSSYAKPKPVPPPPAPGVATGSALPAKPPRASGARSQAGPNTWTVSLTADRTLLWPTQYATLTAMTNMDVGPTPYYLRIYNDSMSQYVGSCGVGTTCTVPVTTRISLPETFFAVVSDSSATFPPAVELAQSAPVTVDWGHLVDKLNLTFAAKPPTAPLGGQVTLVATVAEDIGQSPFTIQLYDEHTLLTQCASGTSCAFSISKSAAATHLLSAYVAAGVFTFPGGQQPDTTIVTAPFQYATWSSAGFTVSLSAGSFSGGSQTFTAMANKDVGPTPYYIEIYSTFVNHEIGICGSGTTCTIAHSSEFIETDVQAFITPFTANVFPFPDPASVAASSNVVNPW